MAIALPIQTRLKKPKGSRGFHLMKRLHAEGFFFKKNIASLAACGNGGRIVLTVESFFLVFLLHGSIKKMQLGTRPRESLSFFSSCFVLFFLFFFLNQCSWSYVENKRSRESATSRHLCGLLEECCLTAAVLSMDVRSCICTRHSELQLSSRRISVPGWGDCQTGVPRKVA
jgi:hypothetical protein